MHRLIILKRTNQDNSLACKNKSKMFGLSPKVQCDYDKVTSTLPIILLFFSFLSI